MTRRRSLIGLLLLAGLLLAGCWDMHDISDRTPVIGVGYDHLESGRGRVTISEATLPQGGASSYQGVIHTGDGATLTEATEDLRRHLARGLYLGSAKVFVLGLAVLQTRSREVLLTLLQRQEIDKTAYVIGTRGTAEALLAKPDGVMGVTAVRLLKEFEVHPQTRDGEVPEEVWQTERGALDTEDTLRMPVFDTLPATSVAQTGTALIRADRLRTVLDPEESATLRWLANLPGRHAMVLDPPLQAYVLKMTRVHTAASYDGSRRHLSLRIAADGEVYAAPDMNLTSTVVRTLSQAGAETITRRVLALTRKMQEAGADGPMWREVAVEAGYSDFDLGRTTVSVQTRVHLLPSFAPSA